MRDLIILAIMLVIVITGITIIASAVRPYFWLTPIGFAMKILQPILLRLENLVYGLKYNDKQILDDRVTYWVSKIADLMEIRFHHRIATAMRVWCIDCIEADADARDLNVGMTDDDQHRVETHLEGAHH